MTANTSDTVAETEECCSGRGRWITRLAVAAGLAAVAGVVAKQLRGTAAADDWESVYTPTSPSTGESAEQ